MTRFLLGVGLGLGLMTVASQAGVGYYWLVGGGVVVGFCYGFIAGGLIVGSMR